jgi:ornithine cyclodeaminase/alanine dehydrogenase-like protein (mu-crystallin family)
MSNWLEPGMHINAIGADAQGKQEFENDVASVCSRFVVDDKAQAFHSGESQHSKNRNAVVDLFHIVESKTSRGVNGSAGARREAEHKGVSFFDSTGLAIEDVALAALVYTNYIQSILDQTEQDKQ